MGSENYPQKYPKLPPDATGLPRTSLEGIEVIFPLKSRQNWTWMDGIGLSIGAGNRSRTYDLRITNALLYQLSYSGILLQALPTAILTEPEMAANLGFFKGCGQF